MPAFQVGADRALALAALVDRDSRVVDDLQERHHALALAVRALDVRAECAHVGPVVAEAAGELAQQRVLFQCFVDAVEVVGHRREVAARELRAARAGVEQRRRRAHEVEAREHLVELDRTRLAVDLAERQAHRDAHVERLRQFDALLFDVQEVAVVQRLQTEVVELQVAVGLQRGAEAGQIELQQLFVEQLGLHALLDVAGEVFGVASGHVGLQRLLAEDLAADRVQQQARGGARVARVFLDQRARGQDRGLVHFVHRHAVVQVALGLGHDRVGLHFGAQARAGRFDHRLQPREIERHALAAVEHRQHRLCHGRRRMALLRALLRAAFAVKHVGTRDFMVTAAHQAELDLVLHVFDVEAAAAGTRAQQRAHDRFGQTVDGFAHARRRRTLRAVHRQKRLHQRHRDLVRLERHDRAIAANDLVALVYGRRGVGRARHRALGGGGLRSGGYSLHGEPSKVCCCVMGFLVSTRRMSRLGAWADNRRRPLVVDKAEAAGALKRCRKQRDGC